MIKPVKLRSIILAAFFCTLVISIALAEDASVYTLQDCVQLGLRNNKEIMTMGLDLDLQMRALKEKYRQFYPNVSISYGDNEIVNLNSQDARDKSLGLSLNQLIYDGDKLKRQIEETRIGLSFTALENNQKKISYIYDIISGYLNLLKLEEKLSLKEVLFENQQKELEVTKRKFDLGEATKLNLYEWEIETGQSRSDVLEISNSLVFERYNFNKTLGYPIEKEFVLKQKLSMDSLTKLPEFNEQSVMSAAMANSLDLQKIQLSIRQARYNSLWRNMFLPDISLTASYSAPPDRLLHPDNNWSLGLNVSLPVLFDNLQIQGLLGGSFDGTTKNISNSVSGTVYQDPGLFRKLAGEQVDLVKLADQYNKAIEEVKLQVKKALSDMKLQYDKIGLLSERINLQEEKMVIIGQQVVLGEAKLSDYITEQNSLSGMKLDRIESVYSFTTSIITIYKLQGKLNEEEIQSFYQDYFQEVRNDN